MSDVGLLREAAAKMRERAECAHQGAWLAQASGGVLAGPWYMDIGDNADAEHVASWDPEVAQAVADWLDFAATWIEDLTPHAEGERERRAGHALKVARRYLGGPA